MDDADDDDACVVVEPCDVGLVVLVVVVVAFPDDWDDEVDVDARVLVPDHRHASDDVDEREDDADVLAEMVGLVVVVEVVEVVDHHEVSPCPHEDVDCSDASLDCCCCCCCLD